MSLYTLLRRHYTLWLLLAVTHWNGALWAEDLLFKRHVINDQTDYSAAALIDVDHDGLLDIVCGGDWYQAPDWTRHFVADIPRIGGRPDGFSHLEFDVNRDGWTDVITVNYRSRSIKWMEHPGPGLGPWTVHTAVEPGPMETGRLVDIDRDGQLDLLPNGANFAAWWEFRWNAQQSPGAPAWIRHDLPAEAGGHGLGFGDIDGDGRGDIVGQNGWLRAPQDARSGRWQWHPDFRIERGSIPMLVVDADEDGDSDIVWCSAHGFGVYWHEQSQDGVGQRAWYRHAIDTSWSQGHSPLWVDLDGNGRMELVAGKRYMAHGGADPGEYDPIVAYRYEYNPETRTWNRWPLSHVGERVGLGLDPKVADIDGDGDLDLLASGRSGLYWLENLGPGNSATRQPAMPVYEDHQNLLVIKSADGNLHPVDDPEAWGLRRYHITRAIETSHGSIPNSSARVPLDIQSERSAVSHQSESEWTELSYQIAEDRRVNARMAIPHEVGQGEVQGIVCMFESGDSALATQIMEDLAARGMVAVSPEISQTQDTLDLPDLVWQAMRAADVLQACGTVHAERIGFIGNALDGQLGMYVAALDQRFVVTVSDASRASQLIALKPSLDYSLAELLAAIAPRSIQIALPAGKPMARLLDAQAQRARAAFELRRVPENLVLAPASQTSDRGKMLDWLEDRFRPRRFGPPARQRAPGNGN